MNTTVIKLKQSDNTITNLLYYKTSDDNVLGSIVILHGMAEHHGRYLDFIQTLTTNGFDVYTYDHRGHGTDKKLSELGYVAKKNGAALLISDAVSVCNYVKENGRSEKLAVLGHSMGSMILRCLMQTFDAMDCAIVSSTTMPPVAVSKLGAFLGSVVCALRGAESRSVFLQKVMFGGKAYTSLCTRTSFDWLTRNNTIVGKYIDDPYCGFLCTASFYRDLAVLAAKSASKRGIAKTRKDLPIFLLSGTKDPVGGYGAQITGLHKIYTSLGFEHAQIKIYPEARHELLNELNYQEVYQDLIAYLKEHLA